MPGKVTLPLKSGQLETYEMCGAAAVMPPALKAGSTPCRAFFSAAHVTADLLADNHPWQDCAIDWERTLAFRGYLYGLGLGVAEAMDTAQRGMGLGWPQARELIERSSAYACAYGPAARLACGAGTDHLALDQAFTLDDVIAAYEEQCAVVERAGSRIILMASRALAAIARSADDYLKVYDRVLSQVAEPVIIHWLGDMFDPALRGYWGSDDVDVAMATALAVIADHATRIDGIKISLLSAEREVAMRRRLPSGVRMYSGDDFNYPALIAGDDRGHSDALLGIFAAIAPAAAGALVALSDGDRATFDRLLAPTVPLSRHIFEAPTPFYKTGIVFMTWLNGHQDHFTMIGGQQGARSFAHLAELFRLADQAGALIDPDRALNRMKLLTAAHGIAD